MINQNTDGSRFVWPGLIVGSLVWFSSAFGGQQGHEPKQLGNSESLYQSGTHLMVGEELEYQVSYSFFNIGIIHFKITDREERNGRIVYKAQTHIESNPSLNWLKEVHIRFFGEMDDSIFSYSWLSEDSSKDVLAYHGLSFDYDKNFVIYYKGSALNSGARQNSEVDTIPVKGRAQDGQSLFFYARENVKQRKQVNIPTFIENKECITFINFQNKIEEMEIAAVSYPVETVFFDGKADFEGVVGLTGGFRGWFSNDQARIPIVARMNVWLGSVKIELKSWKRQGWQPPRYIRPN
jgi:hypothetical protein